MYTLIHPSIHARTYIRTQYDELQSGQSVGAVSQCSHSREQTHLHTYIHIYIYIYIKSRGAFNGLFVYYRGMQNVFSPSFQGSGLGCERKEGGAFYFFFSLFGIENEIEVFEIEF